MPREGRGRRREEVAKFLWHGKERGERFKVLERRMDARDF